MIALLLSMVFGVLRIPRPETPFAVAFVVLASGVYALSGNYPESWFIYQLFSPRKGVDKRALGEDNAGVS